MSKLFRRLHQRWRTDAMIDQRQALEQAMQDREQIALNLLSIMNVVHSAIHDAAAKEPDAWESCDRNPCAPIRNNLELMALQVSDGIHVECNSETNSYQVIRPMVVDGTPSIEIVAEFPIDDFKTSHDAFDAAFAEADRIATHRH